MIEKGFILVLTLTTLKVGYCQSKSYEMIPAIADVSDVIDLDCLDFQCGVGFLNFNRSENFRSVMINECISKMECDSILDFHLIEEMKWYSYDTNFLTLQFQPNSNIGSFHSNIEIILFKCGDYTFRGYTLEGDDLLRPLHDLISDLFEGEDVEEVLNYLKKLQVN